jgi:peptidylprolyl isomerase
MSQSNFLRLLASSALVAVAAVSSAQTAKPAAKPATPVHHTTAAAPVHAAAPPCSKLPDLSPKIPALPAGLPCARPLYTITATPPVNITYVSPLEGPGLNDILGIESSSFSLDYVDTKLGTGPLAAPDKWYTIHYTGYLTDGTKFDSSVDRNDPIVINYGKHMVIPGWDTGFAGMHVGGKRRLFIPYQLAYGQQGKPPIPPKAELIFDVELVAQSDEKPAPKPVPTPNDSASPQPAAAAPAKTPNPDTH